MDAIVHPAIGKGVAESLVAPVPGVRPPRVAVVVGCYNQGAYVEATLRSVAAQSYEDFECVVLDDRSTDGSFDRIEEAIQSLGDRRFRAILRSANGGQMATMLEGLDATSGPFVAFLDADDLWRPDFLERHVLAHMSERGTAAISCSNLALIDAEGTQLAGSKPSFIAADPRRSPQAALCTEEVLGDEVRVFIASGDPRVWFWSSTSAMMFRRTALDALRPAHPERLRICADYYLAKGAHMLGGTVRLERSLGCYRLHGENAFSRNPLYGSGGSLGKPPDHIRVAAREELLRCLCDNAESLVATYSRRYLANALVALAGKDGAAALAEADPHVNRILSALPPERPVKLRKRLKRRFNAWLKRPFGKNPE